MKIRCVWEHNGNDSILYADSFIGAFTRGASKDLAIQKMPSEIKSYLMWKGDLCSRYRRNFLRGSLAVQRGGQDLCADDGVKRRGGDRDAVLKQPGEL